MKLQSVSLPLTLSDDAFPTVYVKCGGNIRYGNVDWIQLAHWVVAASYGTLMADNFLVSWSTTSFSGISLFYEDIKLFIWF
jgi:hypothetical protein